MPQQFLIVGAACQPKSPCFPSENMYLKKAGGGHKERPVISVLNSSKVKMNDDDAVSDEDL